MVRQLQTITNATKSLLLVELVSVSHYAKSLLCSTWSLVFCGSSTPDAVIGSCVPTSSSLFRNWPLEDSVSLTYDWYFAMNSVLLRAWPCLG